MQVTMSYRARETLKLVCWGALVAATIVVTVGLGLHVREQHRLFRESITPEVRAQLNATRAELEKAPLRTLVRYKTVYWPGHIIGVVGAHDSTDVSRRMVMPCPGSTGPAWEDLSNDHFLIEVRDIVKPGAPEYTSMLMACAESIPVTSMGSLPLESYPKQ